MTVPGLRPSSPRLLGRTSVNSSESLAVQDAVYASVGVMSNGLADNLESVRLDVVSESSPATLCRIFGALFNLSIVPSSATTSPLDDEMMITQLHLESLSSHKIDLLQRKIVQQTETLDVSIRR